MNDPRAMLASAGYTTERRSNHSAEILQALDEHPCTYCGQPVGREARASAQCLDCLRKELVADGLPVEEFDRARAARQTAK